MADNLINYTQGTAGGTVATDEVVIGGATVHAQRVKIIDGTEGGTAGLAISSSGVAQTFQSNNGTVSVSSGVVSAWVNTAGTVSVSNAVAAWVNTAGTVSVSNAVAVWPNSAGTIAQLPGSLQGYAEDLASSGGEIGVQVLAIRRATPADSVSADGDFAALQINGQGMLHVAAGSAATFLGKTQGGTLINLTASGTVVPLVSSKVLKVYSEHFTVQGGTITVTVRAGNGGGTLSGPRQFVPGGGVARVTDVTAPFYKTPAGSAIYFEISGSGTVGGDIAWVQEDS